MRANKESIEEGEAESGGTKEREPDVPQSPFFSAHADFHPCDLHPPTFCWKIKQLIT